MTGYFIEQVYTFFEQVKFTYPWNHNPGEQFQVIGTDPGPNWYDVGMGAGTIVFILSIQFLNAKTINNAFVQNNCFLRSTIWFLSTAKMSIVLGLVFLEFRPIYSQIIVNYDS